MSGEDAKLVSIAISCYNHEKYLSDAIESVLAQTYPHFEVIVVDDGSTDGSWDVATSFPQVRCIRQPNAGTPAATRNRGLLESRGRYVVFLDGDDRLLTNALEVGVRHLEANPDCAFAAGHCQSIDDPGMRLTNWRRITETNHYRALLNWNYILTPGAVIFRRDVVNDLGGFNISPDIKGSDDYDMYLRVASRWPVCYHDDVVLEYREHASNLSKDPARMLKSTLTVLRAQYDIAKQSESNRKAYNKGIANWQGWYGEQVVKNVRHHVRERAWGQTFKELRVLLKYSPRLVLRHSIRKTYCILFRVRSESRST